MKNEYEILEKIYAEANGFYIKKSPNLFLNKLTSQEIKLLDILIKDSEKRKAVLTVFITSVVHKIFRPSQDIRKHQDNMPGGYSGRGIDTHFITPFMKEHNFPAMAESGWLTRSLEQNRPYNLKYPGKVSPPELKLAFLHLLDNIQTKDAKPDVYLLYLFYQLISERDRKHIDLAKPISLTISALLERLRAHFEYNYKTPGASRLSVIAIYSVYECFMAELKRFEGKRLLPLEEHTAADSRTGSIGDIHIINHDSSLFEGVEIKHGIKINPSLIRDSYEKFKTHPVKRYYILSTAGLETLAAKEIATKIDEILKAHGCQIIVNGIYDSLKYYLRLLKNSDEFIAKYVENVKKDKALKFEHKEYWNRLASI